MHLHGATGGRGGFRASATDVLRDTGEAGARFRPQFQDSDQRRLCGRPPRTSQGTAVRSQARGAAVSRPSGQGTCCRGCSQGAALGRVRWRHRCSMVPLHTPRQKSKESKKEPQAVKLAQGSWKSADAAGQGESWHFQPCHLHKLTRSRPCRASGVGGTSLWVQKPPRHPGNGTTHYTARPLVTEWTAAEN